MHRQLEVMFRFSYKLLLWARHNSVRACYNLLFILISAVESLKEGLYSRQRYTNLAQYLGGSEKKSMKQQQTNQMGDSRWWCRTWSVSSKSEQGAGIKIFFNNCKPHHFKTSKWKLSQSSSIKYFVRSLQVLYLDIIVKDDGLGLLYVAQGGHVEHHATHVIGVTPNLSCRNQQ